MPTLLTAFPTLSKSIRVKTGYYSAKYSFSYHRNGELFPLESQPTTDVSTSSNVTVLKLMDSNAVWHPDLFDLSILCKCSVNSPVFLFGPNGIAPKNSTIGVAIQWTAKGSSVRGIQPIGVLKLNDKVPVLIEGDVSFPSKVLKGLLSLKVIYYLKEVKSIEKNERHLANIPGTILGELDETRVLIDGNGSVFPIVETSAPGEPLWWVDCNWNDPREDSFTEENFCIHLNTAHKDYPSLNENEGLSNSPLLAEIIATSLQMLITNVLSDQTAAEDTKKGHNLEAGSISAVIHYFMQTFDWNTDINSPEKMAISIRKDLMRRL